MSGAVNALPSFRSHFSLGESTLNPEQIVSAAKEAGYSAVIVADTMTLSGMIELTKAADQAGIRAIIGVRLRVVSALVREKGSNNGAVLVKAFPKDEAGIKQLYTLLSKAFDEDHFYEVPRLSWDDLALLEPGHLIWTTGDMDGIFTRPDAQDILAQMRGWFWNDHVYAELMPVNTPYFDRYNAEAITAINRHAGLPPILTWPILHSPGSFEPFALNAAIQKRGVLSKSYTMLVPYNQDFHPQSVTDLIDAAKQTKLRLEKRYSLLQLDIWKRALLNIDRFADLCSYKWTKQKVSLPKLYSDPDAEVTKLCAVGMKARLFTEVNGYKPTLDQIRDVYIPRLKYELGVLKDLKFADYFLVVSHVVNWSKENGILVGPGRGSVGGSLVAYLVGITDVDPIRFGLLFERFINPSRNDLPDADLDFMSTRRGEVVAHIEEFFGADKVAGISNYGELGASSALRDVGRIFGKGTTEMEIAKFVPKIHGAPVDLETAMKEVPAIKAWAAANPDIWRNAMILAGGKRPHDKLLPEKPGVMRSYGKHAAGVIVSGVPLVERAVVERREGARVVNWNMAVAEDAGLVKLDILGLSTLDTLSRCQSYIWKRRGKRVDLTKIPLDDPDTLALFGSGLTTGVFQFEGGAARRLLKDMARVNPVTFDDLVAANALNRPGPIEAGLVKQYVDRKNGDEAVSFAHPKMEGALRPTYGVLCYQEQVMRVSVDLCNFSLSEADKLRKAMGKKDAALMASYRDKFVDGAFGYSGMEKDEAGELFDVIQGFAGYCFNLSHAVEYSLIAYQMAFLKAHYPVEFYAATLSTVDEGKLQPLVEEAAKLGIEIMPPDINISTNEFEIVTDTRLYIPFNRVKGISDNTGNAILEARAATGAGRFENFTHFRNQVAPRACNKGHVERLEKVGAFVSITPGSLPPLHEDRRRDQHELLPGLMAQAVVINRLIPQDKYALVGINNIIRDMDDAYPKVCNVRPFFGRSARFMAVFDAPNRFEEGDKQFTKAESFKSVLDSLFACGMERVDGYWTGLVKRVKDGSSISQSMLNDYVPYFERELEILKPPLIIALGSTAARYLVPDTAKGSIFDYIGKVFYDRRRDCNILIGFNPAMVYHDPDKQDLLNEIFERAASICP